MCVVQPFVVVHAKQRKAAQINENNANQVATTQSRMEEEGGTAKQSNATHGVAMQINAEQC